MRFSRLKRKISWFRSNLFLSTNTFLFTPEGKLVGKIRCGFVEPLSWMEIYNADDLGRLVIENKISFAFCGGFRSLPNTSGDFRNSTDMDCVVINGEIFVINNLERDALDNPDAPDFYLLPLKQYLVGYTSSDNQ